VTDKKKILVIDDDRDLVQSLIYVLEDAGYAAIPAYDGQEGLDRTRAEKPDLVLLDITMPEKSGVRFYRDVREDPELGSIPVIMVTGVMKQFEQFISSRRQVPPPDAYFSKPVDPRELLDTIKRLLRPA
jgi:DNA-binding response OmpR family regulator